MLDPPQDGGKGCRQAPPPLPERGSLKKDLPPVPVQQDGRARRCGVRAAGRTRAGVPRPSVGRTTEHARWKPPPSALAHVCPGNPRPPPKTMFLRLLAAAMPPKNQGVYLLEGSVWRVSFFGMFGWRKNKMQKDNARVVLVCRIGKVVKTTPSMVALKMRVIFAMQANNPTS